MSVQVFLKVFIDIEGASLLLCETRGCRVSLSSSVHCRSIDSRELLLLSLSNIYFCSAPSVLGSSCTLRKNMICLHINLILRLHIVCKLRGKHFETTRLWCLSSSTTHKSFKIFQLHILAHSFMLKLVIIYNGYWIVPVSRDLLIQ